MVLAEIFPLIYLQTLRDKREELISLRLVPRPQNPSQGSPRVWGSNPCVDQVFALTGFLPTIQGGGFQLADFKTNQCECKDRQNQLLKLNRTR